MNPTQSPNSPLESAIRSALPAPVRAAGARQKEQLFVECGVSPAGPTGPTSPALTKRQAELLALIRQVGGGV